MEHPREALAYYRQQDVARVICEQKHMGSRAVIVVCRDAETAMQRFCVSGDSRGVCYTRTGRPFFSDPKLEAALLSRVADAMDSSGLFRKLDSPWVCLDAEILPWSAKAQELLRHQYAALASAGIASLESADASLADSSDEGAAGLRARVQQRLRDVEDFQKTYQGYCWPVAGLDDYRLAPFHLLASEHAVHSDKPHPWHLQTLARLAGADPKFCVATPFRLVDLADPASESDAIAWWEQLTALGGEGIVVKPLDWIVRSKKGLVQPAIKCRGREYLRIIYGPEYTAPDNIERLRSRGLGTKRALALREFALGLEALHRFVEREPLYRVHECVFGVLALESEPVDPRL